MTGWWWQKPRPGQLSAQRGPGPFTSLLCPACNTLPYKSRPKQGKVGNAVWGAGGQRLRAQARTPCVWCEAGNAGLGLPGRLWERADATGVAETVQRRNSVKGDDNQGQNHGQQPGRGVVRGTEQGPAQRSRNRTGGPTGVMQGEFQEQAGGQSKCC